ncbi:MAG: threonine--tRNA ligase [Truepera sp.]|nr:threonine--tRNA ligase [Truepera sp.]
MQITLPDGKVLELPAGATPRQVAELIPGLAKAAIGARVDDQLTDLFQVLSDGAKVAMVTKQDAEIIALMRHTLAHVMAQAVREYFVAQGFDARLVRLGIGPVIEHGFYYDFDLPRSLTPDDLVEIEARMREIVKQNLALRKYELPRSEAIARYQALNDPYKLELIAELPEGTPLTFYEQGGENGFTDLCRGPHVPTTGAVTPHFKLMSIAGAYWRGDEARPMLQRIYGVAFLTKEELKHHLWQLEEAKKRDHRKLGRELELFTFDDEIGPGLPLWLPRGAIIIEELEQLAKEIEEQAGYQRVRTPHITKEQLFLKSGHLPYYAEEMYPPMELEGVKYYLKPMNCPFHHKIFAARPRSYRELPVRLAEYGTCYRYEKSGVLFGLMRVRSMQMNDAHIYCSEAQFEAEFLAVVQLYLNYFKLFGIDRYVMRLSTHSRAGLGQKYVDNEALWLKTEAMVRRAMDNGGVPYLEVPDEAAFYGPKIDVQIYSAIGKEFTLATNQVDFAQPERFKLHFINDRNESETPLCIHRAPLSTHERMVGFLTEHFAGDFPLWLAPEQVRIVTIADRHLPYARQVAAALVQAGLRASVDDGAERMNHKIRAAELYKIPYTVIVGDQEQGAAQVSFRSRQEPEQQGVPLTAFTTHLQQQAKARALRVSPLAL